MAITNGYATAAGAKMRLGIEMTDATDDAVLESMIEAVSRAIDEYCGRRFYADSLNATRYFTARYADALFTGDMISLATLQTDEDGDRTYERTWSATDYDLTPDNASLDGRPYTAIRITPMGSYGFPVGVRKGVKLTGKWGWSAIPKPIVEACYLVSERLFMRKDAIFGVAGGGDMGVLRGVLRLDEDPEVRLMLQPYVWMGF